jgi:hypothetical protein
MAALQYINAVWSLVAIYWVVGMVLAKPTIKRESILPTAVHIMLGCAAVLLVWEPATGIGLGLAFIAFVQKSAAEEKFMREQFSTQYAQYSQRVRRLIPFVF